MRSASMTCFIVVLIALEVLTHEMRLRGGASMAVAAETGAETGAVLSCSDDPEAGLRGEGGYVFGIIASEENALF